MIDKGILERCSLFATLSADGLRELARVSTLSNVVHPGDVLFEIGDPSDALFVVTRPRRGQGDDAPLARFEFGATAGKFIRADHVGEFGVIGDVELLLAGIGPNLPRRCTRAVAVTPLVVMRLPAQTVATLSESEHRFRRLLVREGARRLLDAMQVQVRRREVGAEIALAALLTEAAATQGTFHGNRVEFARKITQDELASELAVSRRTIAMHLSEWARAGLVTTSPLVVLDFNRLRLLANLQDVAPADVHQDVVGEIDHLLDAGDLLRARTLALSFASHLLDAPTLVFRAALTAARLGATGEAAALLERHGFGPGVTAAAVSHLVRAGIHRLNATDAWDDLDDIRPSTALERQLATDIAALLGRLEKDGCRHAATLQETQDHASRAAAAYAIAHDIARSPFAAVNRAAMTLLAGDKSTATQLARPYLEDRSLAPSYWSAATAAEALLITNETEAARCQFRAASLLPDATDGARASTRRQLRLLAPALAMDPDALVTFMPISRPAVGVGHMIRATDADAAPRADTAERIAKGVEVAFQTHNVGSLYVSLACGADIVLAEAALARGAELHVVMPFSIADFRAASVAIGDADGEEGWNNRFDACLAKAATITILCPGDVPRLGQDWYYRQTFRHCAGRALERAGHLDTEPLLVSVSGGGDRSTIASTSSGMSEWAAHGLETVVVEFPLTRPKPAGPTAGLTVSGAAVVFLYPINDLDRGAKDRFSDTLAVRFGDALLVRALKSRRTAYAIIADTVAEVRSVVERARKCAATSGVALRIICDHGGIRRGEGTIAHDHLTRLTGATDVPGAPPDITLATATYAMEATFSDRKGQTLVPVGARSDMYALSWL
ncbi:Crp/Fnr family transcriptional regulator [Acuticoccus sediminis]|uniref:Crp/Fnr family transcriptional regulator n=1 Tax=Acuticoccus sediminis TaxID=2184697 RepID=UPI001390D4E6|nr:Crp/Fnr family transcriptional regulator [Acuticoccus sediminis]